MESLKKYSLGLPEQEYHDLDAWSYSIIAKYARNGFSSLKEIHQKTEPTAAMKFGSLLDSLLTKGSDTFKDYVVADITVPEAERKAIEYISTTTDDNFDDITKDFIFARCQECGYQSRWKADTTYEHIKPYGWYYTMLKTGKKIVSKKDWEDAFDMYRIFRDDPYLQKLFGTMNSKDVEFIYQAQFLEDYTLPSGRVVKVKIMPDLMVVNHKEKTIQLVDLKTSAEPAWNFKDNFIRFRYDIQAHVYSDIISLLIDKLPDYSEYKILPYLFTDISRSDKVPVTYVYPQYDESQERGLSYVVGEKTYTYKSWEILLDEILDYEECDAVVPSFIKLDEPNDILSILNKQYEIQ